MKTHFEEITLKSAFALISMVFLVACTAFMPPQQASIPTIENKLFVAAKTDEFLHLSMFDPGEAESSFSEKIPFKDQLMDSSYNAHGYNDAVQYNPKTKEVFFLTYGYEEYGGSCINEDGTCVSRIYKISLDEEKPTLLSESNHPPVNWLINPFDDSLMLYYVDGKIQTFKKLHASSGETIFTKLYPAQTGKYYANLTLSQDGRHLYQAGKESFENSALNEILWLRRIDNTTGEIVEQKIHQGNSIEYETNLSPDNRYMAFYEGLYEAENHEKNLFIFDLERESFTQVPFGGRVGNYNLFWSGDSRKLLYIPEDRSLAYYDLNTSKTQTLLGEAEKSGFVYGWGPATDYLAYDSENQLWIYDFTNHQTLRPQLGAEYSNIKGLAWY